MFKLHFREPGSIYFWKYILFSRKEHILVFFTFSVYNEMDILILSRKGY